MFTRKFDTTSLDGILRNVLGRFITGSNAPESWDHHVVEVGNGGTFMVPSFLIVESGTPGYDPSRNVARSPFV